MVLLHCSPGPGKEVGGGGVRGVSFPLHWRSVTRSTGDQKPKYKR